MGLNTLINEKRAKMEQLRDQCVVEGKLLGKKSVINIMFENSNFRG